MEGIGRRVEIGGREGMRGRVSYAGYWTEGIGGRESE